MCTNCGEPGGTPLPGLSLVDARYAEGYCNVCTVQYPSKPRLRPRATNVLVAALYFDRAEFETHKEREKLSALVHRLSPGKSSINLTDKEVYDFVRLQDKYQTPGVQVLPEWRVVAEKFIQAESAPKKRRK